MLGTHVTKTSDPLCTHGRKIKLTPETWPLPAQEQCLRYMKFHMYVQSKLELSITMFINIHIDQNIHVVKKILLLMYNVVLAVILDNLHNYKRKKMSNCVT